VIRKVERANVRTDREFDLSTLAKVYWKHGELPRRVLVLSFSALGAVMAGSGIGLLAIMSGGHSVNFGAGSNFVGDSILLIAGMFLAIALLWLFRKLPAVATKLSVNAEGLRAFTDKGESLSIEWRTPNLTLTIYDWRGTDATRSTGLRPIDFVLDTGARGRFAAAIPLSAALEVMNTARRHDLTVFGWVENPGPSSRGRVIRIRRATS
jgi:hypothetical protein